jgi:hypothetical protein
VKELLDRWQRVKANHAVTIVFFSRTYFEDAALCVPPLLVLCLLLSVAVA